MVEVVGNGRGEEGGDTEVQREALQKNAGLRRRWSLELRLNSARS